MALSKSQVLVTQFYDWEIRGRGWMIAPTPVDLEPPFHPFFEHYVPEQYIDDGKRETFLSSLIKLLRGTDEPKGFLYEPPDYDVFPLIDDTELVAIKVVFARNHKVKLENLERLYTLCAHCEYPVSFELVATDDGVSSYLVCRITDKDYLQSQLNMFFPDASIIEDQKAIENIIDWDKPHYAVDYGLKEEFMRPVSMIQSLDFDPYTSFFGIVETMPKDSRVVLQILFSSVVNKWEKSIIKAVTDDHKSSFFIDAPEMPSLAEEKIKHPLFGVCVRLLSQANEPTVLWGLADKLEQTFISSTASKFNSFIPLDDSEYPADRFDDIYYRQSHRVGMLLNVRELVSIAHFPNPSIPSTKLGRVLKRTKEAPQSVIGHTYTLGINAHRGAELTASLPVDVRLRHIHIIGATGTRKSSFMLHLIRQDITDGKGCAVIDPHGDLIEHIIPFIPKERIKDVVIIDPNDREFPIAFNLLSAHSEVEKEVLASDLVALFKRHSTSWGDQMNSVFANAIIAFLDNTKGGTLPDLRRFLLEKDFREEILKTVTDLDIAYYWRKEFPLLKGGSIAPILTRLDTFLRPKIIRSMVSQKKSLHFQSLMDTNKIILVKLSEGMIGAENSYLLGSFIVSKIQQAAMARQAIETSNRVPFFLYMDEFQHFITPSMASMLSGVRKYGLGLVLAHQDMMQVSKADNELAGALLANSGTRICFRVGDQDAKRLSEGFASFGSEDLQNLSAGEAIVRVGKNEDDFNLTAFTLLSTDGGGHRDEIIAFSREHYASTTQTDKPTDEDGSIENDTPPPTPTPPPPPTAEPIIIPPKERTQQQAPKATTQHRQQQTIIKKTAEAHGYKASIEVAVPNGSVDVLLEKDNETIAVEVSVTTDAQWEFHNIQKCLSQRYTYIFSCIDDAKTRHEVTAQLEKMTPVPTNVFVYSFEDVLVFLKQQNNNGEDEKRIKGYRVKSQHRTLTTEEVKIKRAIIESIVKGKS